MIKLYKITSKFLFILALVCLFNLSVVIKYFAVNDQSFPEGVGVDEGTDKSEKVAPNYNSRTARNGAGQQEK